MLTPDKRGVSWTTDIPPEITHTDTDAMFDEADGARMIQVCPLQLMT